MRSLIRYNQLNQDVTDNISGVTIPAVNAILLPVHLTGNETISGLKVFAITPQVSGYDLVAVGGSQTISGIKTFNTQQLFNSGINFGTAVIFDPSYESGHALFDSSSFNEINLYSGYLGNNGVQSLNWFSKVLSGNWSTNTTPTLPYHIVNLNYLSGTFLANLVRSTGDLTSKTIYVSKSSEATDNRGSLNPYNFYVPFATISGAMNVAASGDLINVGVGTFNECIFLKNGVNMWFAPGSIVNDTSSSGAFRLQSTTNSIIGGNGTFISNNVPFACLAPCNLRVWADSISGANGSTFISSSSGGKYSFNVERDVATVVCLSDGVEIDVKANLLSRGININGQNNIINGYASIDTPGLAIWVSGNNSSVKWVGNISADSDAVDGRGNSKIEVWGDLVSRGDTPIFCENSQVYVYGNAYNKSTYSYWNLKGNGNAILCNGGTGVVYGDLKGIVPISNNNGVVTVHGDVIVDYNGTTPTYREYFNENLYTSAFVAVNGGGGSQGEVGCYVNASGTITGTTIASQGFGYTGAPILSVLGIGTGASLTCTVSGGAINSVSIVSGGSGYLSNYEPQDIATYLGHAVVGMGGNSRTYLKGNIVSSNYNAAIRAVSGEMHCFNGVGSNYNSPSGHAILSQGGYLVFYPGCYLNTYSSSAYAVYSTVPIIADCKGGITPTTNRNFTNNISFPNNFTTSQSIYFNNPSAGADSKLWNILSSSADNLLTIRALDDNNFNQSNAITIYRNGYQINGITINPGTSLGTLAGSWARNNYCGFSATGLSTTNIIPAGTTKIVSGISIARDPYGVWNGTYFTAPRSGWYHFSARTVLDFNYSGTTRINCSLITSGLINSTTQGSDISSSSVFYNSAIADSTIYVASGDKVYFQVGSTNSGRLLATSDNTYINGYYVGD